MRYIDAHSSINDYMAYLIASVNMVVGVFNRNPKRWETRIDSVSYFWLRAIQSNPAIAQF